MEWTYQGSIAEFWQTTKGFRQSPINIAKSKWKTSQSFTKLKFQTHYYPDEMIYLAHKNDNWIVTGESNLSSRISGGPLNGTYELFDIHAHWTDNENGSEHTIDDLKYPCELHLMHFNRLKYQTIDNAFEHQDGLCIIAVFLKIGKANPEIQKIVKQLPMHKHESVTLTKPINPKGLLPKKLRYWAYWGSLARPPCTECVVWILMHEVLDISEEQLNTFRNMRRHPKVTEECERLECGDKIQRNCRPLCPLGKRMVIRTRYKHED